MAVVAEKLKSEKLDFNWLVEVKGEGCIGFIQLLLHQVDPGARVLERTGDLEPLRSPRLGCIPDSQTCYVSLAASYPQHKALIQFRAAISHPLVLVEVKQVVHQLIPASFVAAHHVKLEGS